MAKIFGIGLSRTGSTSLARALTILGYRAAHFPADPVTQREYFQFFAHPSDTLTLSILDRYDAITDTPLPRVYRQLDRTYPGSKFILTVRDKASWLRSCELWWERSVVPFVEHDRAGQLKPFIELVGRVTYGTAYFNAALFSRAYDTHIEEVLNYFRGRSRDLLVLDICRGEGWQQLAPFTGRLLPGVSFPHLNEMVPDPQ